MLLYFGDRFYLMHVFPLVLWPKQGQHTNVDIISVPPGFFPTLFAHLTSSRCACTPTTLIGCRFHLEIEVRKEVKVRKYFAGTRSFVEGF